MNPVSGKNFPVAGLALGNLIFMVRENQILSARMNVDFLSQIFSGHNGAFNMPAWPSLTPGRLPVRLPLFFGFPQYKIQGIFLFFPGYFNITVPRLQVIQIFMRQFSVFFKFPGTEVNGTVCRRIGKALFNQGGNHFQHTVNFFCGQRMGSRRLYIHGCHVLFALSNVTL